MMDLRTGRADSHVGHAVHDGMGDDDMAVINTFASCSENLRHYAVTPAVSSSINAVRWDRDGGVRTLREGMSS